MTRAQDWQPIATAPKDGGPVWVRGWDWGKPGGSRHCCWAWWDGQNWRTANAEDSSEMTYLTDWLVPPPSGAAPVEGE